MLQTQFSEISHLINDAIGQPCTLCDRPSDLAGVFVPDDPQSWGAPCDKARFIVYPVCSICLTEKDCSYRVEAVLSIDLNLVSSFS